MCLECAIPVLRVNDIEKAKGFYLDYLKFDIDWEYKVSDGQYTYLQISKGTCVLHLTEYFDDLSGSDIRIEAENLHSYQQLLDDTSPSLGANSTKHTAPEIIDMDWGTKDMSVLDPFGNRITFTSGVTLE